MTRPTTRDIFLLSAACALMYLPGLTTRGLMNWQEAQRALVAREMHARGDWIVPTAHAEPYLAKPPLIYWCQLSLAALHGRPPTEADLRLTVAIAGWLGVLATYVAGRRLLSIPAEPGPATADGEFPRRAAFWSALFLATGVLYARASRIGELDILLVPLTAGAIAAIHAAWRSHVERDRTHWAAVGFAVLAAIGAALAKGPPGLLAIALGGYGGIALHAVFTHMTGSNPASREHGLAPPWQAWPPLTRRVLIGAAIGGVAFLAAGIWFTWSESKWSDRITGLLLFDAMGDIAGGLVAVLTIRPVGRAVFGAFARTHPLAVLGLPLLALWGWLWAARVRIGEGPVFAAVREEAGENLRLFVLESPMNNLGAAAYGVGAGSLTAWIACVWLLRSRPRLTPGIAFVIAWAGLSLIAFSILGKGVGRYLTPVWPAIAMLGGAWFAWRPGGDPRPGRVRAAIGMGTIALGAGLGVWYGVIGARQEMTPREFVAELLAPPVAVDPARLATFEFATPQIDYYAGRHIESFTDAPPHAEFPGTGPRTVADLREQLRREAADGNAGAYTLLIRRTQPDFLAATAPALDRIRAAGLEAEPIPLVHRFVTDNRRTEIIAVRVRAR